MFWTNTYQQLSRFGRTCFAVMKWLLFGGTFNAGTPMGTGSKVLDELIGGGVLPGGVAVISGPSGSGKTWFLDQIAAYHIQSGRRVMYIAGEQTFRHILARIESLLPSDVDNTEALHRLQIMDASGKTLLDIIKVFRDFQQIAHDWSPNVVLIDGLADLNSPVYPGLPPLFARLHKWAAECSFSCFCTAQICVRSAPGSSTTVKLIEMGLKHVDLSIVLRSMERSLYYTLFNLSIEKNRRGITGPNIVAAYSNHNPHGGFGQGLTLGNLNVLEGRCTPFRSIQWLSKNTVPKENPDDSRTSH